MQLLQCCPADGKLARQHVTDVQVWMDDRLLRTDELALGVLCETDLVTIARAFMRIQALPRV